MIPTERLCSCSGSAYEVAFPVGRARGRGVNELRHFGGGSGEYLLCVGW